MTSARLLEASESEESVLEESDMVSLWMVDTVVDMAADMAADMGSATVSD
jgi:hypothetical protein